MEYLSSNISYRYHVSEPANLYEIDLVKQWLNISPGTTINTINAGKIIVINAGMHNKHEGPDINDAILIINDRVVKGPVECHICTSDWYKHGHNENPAYQSVILHVVRKLNKRIVAPTIPTILLKPGIYNSNWCSLNNINKSPYLVDIILHYGNNRWLEKINSYNGYHDSQKQLIKLLISRSFKILGVGGNEKQFTELANNINYEKFQCLTMQEGEKYLWDAGILLKIGWVKRGIRPAQQPQNRMKLATELIHYFSNCDFDRLPRASKVKILFATDCPSAAGIGIQTEMLGNILIPFYAARALYLNKIEDYQNYYESWNHLKLSNTYNKYRKRYRAILHSTQLKSFSTLQGLIEIDNNWCSKNLCHICPLKTKNYVVS
ncbi:DUF2851 family protein [bacterium]|nr:DUF2851 family protein [bacterium]